MKISEIITEGVAGPKSCWPNYRKVGTQPGTGKNKGKRVNDCKKIKEHGVSESALRDKDDLIAKRKALQDLERDSGSDKEAIRQRKLDLEKEARSKGISETSLNEFSSGDDDNTPKDDPYKYPKPEQYRRSIDFFGKFEANHFDKEDMDDTTGVFKGYWYYGKKLKQIAYFKFNNPQRTGSNDPGMGWYYEPQDDDVAENSINEFVPGGNSASSYYAVTANFVNEFAQQKEEEIQDLIDAGWTKQDLAQAGTLEGQAADMAHFEQVRDSFLKGLKPGFDAYLQGDTQLKDQLGEYWIENDLPLNQDWEKIYGEEWGDDGLDEFAAESTNSDQLFDQIEEMVEALAAAHGVDSDVIWEDFDSVDDHELLDEAAAWRTSKGKNKNGGLNAKGVASYRRENPGSKLQTAVTTKPSKLKKGSKAAKRRKSFCARMGGVKGPMKKPNGKPTRKALALRKWNC